ncbi:MAG TPA: FmdB family zinc ribbon protein [Solirubrobacteraceae bacterium]|nr:FmdB family zinc ribbon protein [Solirubrobacteraceae bacterium]
MPIYEYRRPDGTTFEVMQRITEDALRTDPDSGVPVERVMHPVAVHFKGKGFYNTDYGTKKRSREMEGSASEGADKQDAKTAEKKSGDKGSSDSSSSSSSSSGAGDAKAAKASSSSPSKQSS